MADAKMLNLAKVKARLARIPRQMQDAVAAQLKKEVDDLAQAQKRAMEAQYDDDSDHGHQRLVDSLHAYPNPDRPLSFRILADARDAKGKFIGANVEQGHRARDGTHVAAQPAFWPTYRARKKGMKRRLLAASRKVAKDLEP